MHVPNSTTLILQSLIHQNVELQHNKANCKEIDIVAVVNENIAVFADGNMLNTVLRKLISNAIKFTPKSGTIRRHSQMEFGNEKKWNLGTRKKITQEYKL
jgi:signal transduction histidine kinase